MKGFAVFFRKIGNGLASVNKNLERMEDTEKYTEDKLKLLYEMVQKEADSLLKECERFMTRTTDVKVDIGVLERFEKENFSSYIDEWFNNFPSEKKHMKSTTSFLKKANVRVRLTLHHDKHHD